ncbi:MAG: hypothetical protein AAF567_14425 [Actinomycetota bacterium]
MALRPLPTVFALSLVAAIAAALAFLPSSAAEPALRDVSAPEPAEREGVVVASASARITDDEARLVSPGDTEDMDAAVEAVAPAAQTEEQPSADADPQVDPEGAFDDVPAETVAVPEVTEPAETDDVASAEQSVATDGSVEPVSAPIEPAAAPAREVIENASGGTGEGQAAPVDSEPVAVVIEEQPAPSGEAGEGLSDAVLAALDDGPLYAAAPAEAAPPAGSAGSANPDGLSIGGSNMFPAELDGQYNPDDDMVAIDLGAPQIGGGAMLPEGVDADPNSDTIAIEADAGLQVGGSNMFPAELDGQYDPDDDTVALELPSGE